MARRLGLRASSTGRRSAGLPTLVVTCLAVASVALNACATMDRADSPSRSDQTGRTAPSTASTITATNSASKLGPSGPRAVTLPPAGGRFDYQIGGGYRPDAKVRVLTRDRSEQADRTRYSICYVNAFQTQPEAERFWTTQHPNLLLRRDGKPVVDPDWPGEYVLDTSTDDKRTAVAAIVDGWIDGCAASGYRAVEPDNLDSYSRSHGRLSQADNLALVRLLAERAHARGLAIAQKNAPELGRQGKTAGLDFAVAEECQVYAECDDYRAVYGRQVIEIEYTDTPRRFFNAACQARGQTISVLLRDRDVLPRGTRGHHAEYC